MKTWSLDHILKQKRTRFALMILAYAGILGMSAVALQFIEYRYLAQQVSTELYVFFLAIGFTALGVWLARSLSKAPARDAFERNTEALASLGLTPKELQVLEQLAAGHSNKVIAEKLGVSVNTIKTHVSNLFGKLKVESRLEAITFARSLNLIP